jgi:hypothetical protein
VKRLLTLVAALLVVGALLGGCGAGSRKATSGAAPAADRATAPAAAPNPAPQAAKPAEQSAAPTSVGVPIPDDRKIIMNAQFDVRVKDSDDAIAHISQAVRASGGFVQDMKQSGTPQQGRTVNMTLRVPSNQYGTIIDLVNGLGEVNQRREWTEDVTEQYVDLQARITTGEAHLQQLQKLYERSGSIKEMMDLEQEISRVTADLESMKGRIRVLANRVDLSTVMVNLYEPGVPTPIQTPKTVLERMKLGFTSSWNGVVNFTGNLVVLLVTLLPILVYLTVLGGIGYAIYRVIRAKAPRRSLPTLPPTFQPPLPPAQTQPAPPTQEPPKPNE